MKSKNTLRPLLAIAASSLMAVSSVHAQSTLYWDGGSVDLTDPGNGASGGTSGTWDTTILNWDAGASYVAWDNANEDIAVFAGTAGTVTLGTGITAGGLTFSTTGYIITGSTLTLAGATAPVLNVSTGTSTISSDIDGTAGLEKTGGGTLVLSGTNNTYSGTTTISAGTLQGIKSSTSGPSPFGTSTIQLNAGTLGSFTVSATDAGETFTFGNDINVGGNATINFTRIGGVGSGKTHAYGNLSIGSSTLSLTANAISHTLSFTGANLTGNAIINTGSNANTNIGAITETGGPRNLTKQGVATLRLTGKNTYTGTTTISGGTLEVQGSIASSSSIINNATLTFNSGSAQSNSNVISGSGSLIKLGSGTLSLLGSNTYTGTTTIGDLTTTSATLLVNTLANYGEASSLGAPTSGAIIFGKNAVHTLIYAGSGSETDRTIRHEPDVSNRNNGSGIYNNGTGALIFTGTTFNTPFVASGNGNRTTVFNLGGTYTGSANEIRGVIANNDLTTSLIAIAKVGGGTWTLGGINTYTGTTTLNAGTLRLNYDTGAAGTNDTKLSGTAALNLNGGTLELNGGSHLETVGSTTLNNGTTFLKQTGGGSSTLSMGAITFTGGALDLAAGSLATTTTANNASGVLGSTVGANRITVGAADWGANDGAGNIVVYSGYTAFTGAATSANINYSSVGSVTLGGNRGATSNSFKITTTGTGQAMDVGTNQFTLGSLLFAGAHDYAITTSGAGRINSAFILHNYGTGGATLTLGAMNGTMTQFGTGKTILSAAATANNALNVFGGTVQFSNNLQIGTNTGVVSIGLNNGTLVADTSGGDIALNNAGANSRTIALGAGGGTLDVIGGNKLTVSGVISDTAGQLPVLTIGSATSNGTIELTAANTYRGETRVAGGTLKLGANNVLPNGSAVSIGTATLDADTRIDTVGTLDVTGSAVINLGYGAALVFANSSAGGSGTWAGTLNLIGFVSGSSLNFGSPTGLTAQQLGKISATGFSNFSLDAEGDLIADSGGGSPFDAWAATGTLGPVTFDGDANGDGVQDGLAFLLGAASPDANATGLLPTTSQTGGNLVMNFTCLATADRGTTTLTLEYDGDLVGTWLSVPVPGAVGNPNPIVETTTTGSVSFVATDGGTNGNGDALIDVEATISDATESASGKLFGRLKAVNP